VIAFATLLLGLIVGSQTVELVVGKPVTSVEILLDGRRVGVLRGGNWSLPCDFGPDLEPHELVAIGFDSDHREVARARQWVNLPRGPAETSVAFEGGEDGKGVVARLSWESVVGAEPLSVRATFDGRPLEVSDPRRIRLPSFDPDQLHLFRAELDFSANVSSLVEAAFAGSFVDRVNSELTAVPVVLEKGAELPPLQRLQGRFWKDNRRLLVVGAEEGPAEVVFVRDEAARRALVGFLRLSEKELRRRARTGRFTEREADRESSRKKISFLPDLKIRFLWPYPERQKRPGYDLEVFPPSAEFTGRDGGFYWLLSHVRQPPVDSDEPHFEDAVAAAGLLAAGRNRRRAVVLLLGSERPAADASRFGIGAVRAYLDDLGVPLLVWTTAKDPAAVGDWGPAVEVSSLGKLERAVKTLYRTIGRQRIIWLDGTHLPQDLDLRSEGLRIELVR
jgi:hypothetical protein